MTSNKHRAFYITTNNYQERYDTILNDCKKYAKYFVLGKEIGPEKGTGHLHSYVQYKSPRSWGAIKDLFGAGSEIITSFKGPNAVDNIIEYCIKDLDYEEQGIRPCQGKRTDIDNVRETIKSNPSRPMREVTATATSYQSIKVAEQYLKYHEVKRDWKPEVKWYYGPSGSGKSKLANEEMPNAYHWDTVKWWDGYDAHEDVLIDDFRKNMCTFSELLKILDRYSYRVETKGGARSLLARRITITCPFHPSDVYSTREDTYQLIRRIDTIQSFGDEELH